MLDLVFYSDSTLKAQPYTTPEVIAANTGNSLKSVNQIQEKTFRTFWNFDI